MCEAQWSGYTADTRDLAVLWLHLTNSYGSIPQKLVETTLDKQHTPNNIKDIIMDNYDNFNLRFTWLLGTSRGTASGDQARWLRGS